MTVTYLRDLAQQPGYVKKALAGYVFQAAAHVPQFNGNYPVIGGWYVIDQGACEMGARESDTPITNNFSRFVPHLFDIPILDLFWTSVSFRGDLSRFGRTQLCKFRHPNFEETVGAVYDHPFGSTGF